jgi:hypothetical protein
MEQKTFTSSTFDNLPVKPKITVVEDPWIGGRAYCLHDFDTPEVVDCYSIGEMVALRDMIDAAITKHRMGQDDPNQLSLWPELTEEYL